MHHISKSMTTVSCTVEKKEKKKVVQLKVIEASYKYQLDIVSITERSFENLQLSLI
jgi:hypothetical protein